MIKLCPDCGSAKLSYKTGPLLTVGDTVPVSCTSCGWRGAESDLLTPVDQRVDRESSVSVDTDDASFVASEVAQDYLVALSKYAAREIGRSMVVAGLVGVHDAKPMARLIRAATIAAHKATLDEITSMQLEISEGVN
jgi:hypothetical protein